MTKTEQIQNFKEEWARLWVDESEDSQKAIPLLRNAGYCVVTLPISGISGPELRIGRNSYYGLREIIQFLKDNDS